MNKAQSAAADSNKKLNSAQSVVNATKSQQSTQQATVDTAQQGRDQVSAAASDSLQKVANAQNALSAARTNVETTSSGVVAAQKNLASAQQAQNAASQAAANGVAAVSSAKSAVSSAKSAQKHVEDQITTANTKLNDDSVALSAAEQAVNDAQSALDQLKGIDDSQNESLPTFNFTADQATETQALAREISDKVKNNQYEGSATIEGATSFTAWENAITNSQLQAAYHNKQWGEYFALLPKTYNDWTDQSSKDKNTIVDLKNITTDQATELSVFTAKLFNKIADQLGVTGIVSKNVVTKGAVALAVEVAKICTRDNASGGHYIYALHQAYYDHGLSTTPGTDADKIVAKSNDYGESLSTYSTTASLDGISMAEIKENLVQGIAGMLFADEDSGMGHATSVCGIDSIDNEGKDQPIGVAPSTATVHDTTNNLDFHALALHINQPDVQLLDSSNPKQAGITDPVTQKGASPDEIAQAQATLTAKQNDKTAKQAAVKTDNDQLTKLNKILAGKQQAVQQAQQQLDAATDAMKSLNAALASAQDDVSTASTKLMNATTQHQSAQQQANRAAQALTAAQNDQRTKQATLASAQDKLTTEQSKLSAINRQFSTQQTALAVAQRDYRNKQQDVAAAQQTVT